MKRDIMIKDNKYSKTTNNEKEIKLKSEYYNRHDAEKIDRREDTSDVAIWGFVFGFLLFFIILICLILFVK